MATPSEEANDLAEMSRHNRVLFRLLLFLLNEIRALQGQPAVTMAQLKARLVTEYGNEP